MIPHLSNQVIFFLKMQSTVGSQELNLQIVLLDILPLLPVQISRLGDHIFMMVLTMEAMAELMVLFCSSPPENA